MKNIFKQKRNILIMMFALVVIMGIGFAAYSQQLQINDKSSIDSNWDIYISKVTPGTPVGGATGTGAPDPDEKTKANLTTDLKYPGDSITYTIDVTNGGTVDAEVEKVELKPLKENTVIKYSIIDEANIQYLNAGDTKQFKVKVEYDPEKTGTATDDEKSNTLTLTIDYVQKGTGSGTYVPGVSTFTGTVYRKNIGHYLMDGKLIDDTVLVYYNSEDYTSVEDAEGDFYTTELDCIRNGNEFCTSEMLKLSIGDYVDNPSSLGTYYLKHIIENDVVKESYVCFVTDTEHCMQGGNSDVVYPVHRALFQSQESWFTAKGGSCYYLEPSWSYSHSHCDVGGFSIGSSPMSYCGVYVEDNGGGCTIGGDGISRSSVCW